MVASPITQDPTRAARAFASRPRMGPAIVETLAAQDMMMSPDSPGNLLAVIEKRLG